MASTLDISTSDQQYDWSAWRIGQHISYANLRFVADRDPYGSLLVYELPETALAEWNLLKEKDGEPIEKNDDIKKIMDKPWKEIVKYGAGYERQFGQSYLLILKSDNPTTNGQPFLKVYEPAYTEKIAYYQDQTIKKMTLWDFDPVTGKQIKIIIGAEEEQIDEDKGVYGVDKLVDLFWNIIRHKKHWWKAASYLEPIWDEIQGLRAIRMGATLYGIRYGAGLKIIKIPEGTPPEVVEEMKLAAQRLESFNGWFLVPIEGAEIAIDSGSGMVNYESLKAVVIQSISAKTGLPRAAFEGIEMERQGGSFNEQRIFDYWRQLQREYESRLKWAILRFNDFHGFGISEDNFPYVEWSNRKTLTEMEQAELAEKQAGTEATLVAAGIKHADESRTSLGLEGPAPEPRADITIGMGQEDEEADDEDE